jgi:hypothetical protein
VICPSREVRKNIHDLGATMPENLPVTEPHWIEDDRGQRHCLFHDVSR